jgi:hypothetical protein
MLDGPFLACCRALRRLVNGSYAKQAQKSGDNLSHIQESWDIRIKSVSREKPGVQRAIFNVLVYPSVEIDNNINCGHENLRRDQDDN